jgi:hypothetical protein
MKQTVEAYQDAGSTDPDWDGPAKRALTEFARYRGHAIDDGEPVFDIIVTNCEAAVQARCDDPLVRYLQLRFGPGSDTNPQQYSDACNVVESNMQKSGYSTVRKFYSADWAIQQFYRAYYKNGNQQVLGKLFADEDTNLMASIDDPATPPGEVYDVCHEALHNLSGGEKQYDACSRQIEKKLAENWPGDPVVYLLEGEIYIQRAWFARGNGYANTVTSTGWKTFGKDLAKAEKYLNQAWDLDTNNPDIAVQMLTVELGQGGGRDLMELWFDRAMQADPDCYDACSSKLYFLEPKWYGSTGDMLEFGHECIENTNWGGAVPLILVDAHYSIWNQYTDADTKSNYWTQPEVWADVNSAYQRYFQLNPTDTYHIPYYAWYAYQAQAWSKFNELIPKLGPANYNFFGGEAEFAKMVQKARGHTNQPADALSP